MASSSRTKPPLSLSSTPGLPPQPTASITHDNSRITATLPTGESVEVLLYGATITSWKDAKGDEKLWLSDAADLSGKKAVRGGVPLVFPVSHPPHSQQSDPTPRMPLANKPQVFGKPTDHPATSALPQHGFARTSRWEFLGKSTSESNKEGGSDDGVKLDFGLGPENLSDEARKAWSGDFGLIYSVTLAKDSLKTSILIRNEGEGAWDFQVLMHTYLRVTVSKRWH